MGESITEGSIAEILKKEGEPVSMDEVIAQIETDKVTVDVRAPDAGVVKSWLVAEGDTINVGQPLAQFFVGGTATAAAPAPSAPAGEFF